MRNLGYKSCLECGEVFGQNRNESRPSFQRRQYCGHACVGKSNARKHKGKVYRFNFHHSEESKEKNRLAHWREKGSNWKGGISRGDNQREYYRIKCLERYAKQKGAEGTFTTEEWVSLKRKFGFRCVSCKRPEGIIKLVKDHIIPLSKGGTNYITNIQPLCVSCNCKKHTNIMDYTLQYA